MSPPHHNRGPNNRGPNNRGPNNRGPHRSGPPRGGPPRDKFRGADRMRGRRAPKTLNIVFEDRDLLVVDKPLGMVSATPEPTGRTTLFDLVKDHVRARHGRQARAWVIHRLDMEASGLLVFAKSEQAYAFLKAELRARKMHRLYAALVEHPYESGAGSDGMIHTYLRERMDGSVESFEEGSLQRPPDPKNPHDPKPATTHYRVEHQNQTHALVRVRLETGRKHQIRVHLRESGHPIVGDYKYGTGSNPLRRLALHAMELGFTHPTTGQAVRFRSPPPPELMSFIEADEETLAPDEPLPEVMPSHVAPQRAPEPASDEEADQGWDHVAEWYADYQTGGESDHFERVILPGTLGLLGARPDDRVLDIACGEGSLCRRLAQTGVRCLGVDASPELIDHARRQSGGPRYEVADARDLSVLGPILGEDLAHGATCVMALMNIDPIGPVFRGIASLLEPGGRFVFVVLHPAFRAPKQTSWGWDGGRSHKGTQYRRVDAYLSPRAEPIVMNPGEVASGASPVTTTTHHRPIEHYVRALTGSGFVVEAIEEWASARKSQPGPRAHEENRARREIPMFLAVRATLRTA